MDRLRKHGIGFGNGSNTSSSTPWFLNSMFSTCILFILPIERRDQVEEEAIVNTP
jgi:hypothetical protein